VQKSIPYLERSVHLGQVGSFPFMFRSASSLGYAYALSGRIADALPLLDHCASQDLSETRIYSVPRVYLWTGEAYLMAGRLDEAAQMAVRAQGLAQRRRERGRLAVALRLLGEIAVHRDPPEVESVEAYYRQALVAAEELGMRPLQAHCHFGLGKLYRCTGKHAHAQEHLVTAAACTARWTWASGWRRRRRNSGHPIETHTKPGSQPGSQPE
jgi:tetratricopeptide (TPR) repeat protein